MEKESCASTGLSNFWSSVPSDLASRSISEFIVSVRQENHDEMRPRIQDRNFIPDARLPTQSKVNLMENSTSQRWGIIGGGILGMTVAHRLAQAGQDVTLIETAPHLGGLADAWTVITTSLCCPTFTGGTS